MQHNKSINNIKSLNFFKSVDSKISDGSSNKKKIIDISVVEKATGQISAGAGVGTNGGSVGFSVKENNFLGRGIEFGTDVTVSADSIKGLVSLENPNFKGTDKSLALTIENTVNDRMKNYGYKSNKTGFSVNSGSEYFDDLFLVAGLSLYQENLKTDSTATANIQKQKGSYFDTYFNYSINYDKRDQSFQPTDGYTSKFKQSIPIVSDSYTIKNSYNYKVYNEWLNENIASMGFHMSTVHSLNQKNVRLSDRVFIPSNKLRGFESGKVGPRDGVDYIGGNYSMTFNVASTIPQILPNLQNTDFSVFFDAANIWGIDYSGIEDDRKIRSSIGVAVDFFTPIGPLNFSLSEVISKGNNDITESFRFNLGTTF